MYYNLKSKGIGKQKIIREEKLNNMQSLGLVNIAQSFAELSKTTTSMVTATDKTELKLNKKDSFHEDITKYHQFQFSSTPGYVQCRSESDVGDLKLQIVTEDKNMEF